MSNSDLCASDIARRRPADVASTVASPLERRLGQIADDVTETTSASSLASARINLQFDIERHQRSSA